MKRYLLSKEFVAQLNEHPYVEQATEWSIRFTSEFKQMAYEAYMNGKSMREIFTEAGFDVKQLGKGRLQNFRNKLVVQSDRECGFEDGRRNNSHQEPQSTEAQLLRRIRELEHRNAYLEQENDFLKKIQQLEKDSAGKVGKQK